ncbi:AlbA family DNA-binding domain-containing protein [Melioribacter sp. OK-6-Me]|uniref:AlbA family DNA-binding domain-containing protein n=1 Tax=unclassified Melioribacter TaxID=2627329 RepID=UPI003ED951E7
MNRKKILELIEGGESLYVEFKQRFSSYEKIAKEMMAFANTRGGYLLFGVDDDKKIYGIESEKSDLELIEKTAREFIEPPIEYSTSVIPINDKEIMVVEIKESKLKPHRLQDYKPNLDLNNAIVYVRINDKSVQASKEMIKLLQTQSAGVSLKNYSLGKNEKIVFDYLDRHETITVKTLCKIANISERRASRTLIKLVRANILLIHINDRGESYFTYAG